MEHLLDISGFTHANNIPAGVPYDPLKHKLFFKEAVLAALLKKHGKDIMVENKPISCRDDKIRYRLTTQCVRDGLVIKQTQVAQ